MATATDKSMQATQVRCELCRQELPVTQATVAEAADGPKYFCRPECHEQWQHGAQVELVLPSELYG